MTNIEIADLYQRDIRKLIGEIEQFQEEPNLWKTVGAITNSSGNLVLHILGGLNFHIGTTLAKTGYERNRDQEFIIKDVPKALLVAQLNELARLIRQTIVSITNEQLNEPFPRFFDKENATTGYVLTQLLLHLNYHTGQVNYLRRALEARPA